MSQIIRFDLHGGQIRAWKALFGSAAREVYLLSGIQGGKTIFGTFATREYIDNLVQPGDNILIGAPTYKIMEQSTMITFKKLHGPVLGDYNRQDGYYKLRNGATVWFRTSTDPDSVEGIPDCVFAWIDEIGKCHRSFWINCMARLARRKGKLLGTSTWYALNWMYQERWKPWKLKELPDVEMVYFSSKENPSFPADEFERQRKLLTPADFKRKFEGEPAKMHGLVWEVGDELVIPPMTLPVGTKYYAGVDWGYEHPFAVIIRAITPDKQVFDVSEFKRSHLDPNEKIAMMKSKMEVYDIDMVYADPEDPAMIAAFNKAGIKTVAFHTVNERYKRVMPGVELHGQLIRSGKYRIFNTCKALIDEYETYHWPENIENKTENPEAINDDLMCCARMLTVGTSHYMTEKVHKEPPPVGMVRDNWKPGKEKKNKHWAAY